MFLHRFIGATVGAGKSPTWNKVIGEYGFMRKCMNLKDNVVALKGSKEQVEDTLIEHDGNVVFYTVESMIEDSMSAASAIDSRQLSRTVYDSSMCLVNGDEEEREDLSLCINSTACRKKTGFSGLLTLGFLFGFHRKNWVYISYPAWG